MFQVANYLDLEDPVDEEDDDPKCVCGVYRSEHSPCGCPEGFQTLVAWVRERDAIRELVFSQDQDHPDYYGSYDEYY